MSKQSLGQRADVRALIDHLEGIAVWIVSEPGTFDYISDGFEEIWEIPAETVMDDPGRLIETIHPDDRETVRGFIEGSQGEDTTTAATYEGRVVRPDGSIRWVQTRQVPIWDGDENLANVVGICTDITDQKAREEELEALNRLLRHDIRNDMNVLLAWAEMLEEHVDPAGQELLEKMQTTSQHIVELTEGARTMVEMLTVQGELKLEPVGLRRMVETELSTRRENFPEAEIVIEGEFPDVRVPANEMLGSLIRNLLNNAVQHNDSETPVVEVSGDVDGSTVLLRVADNGPGIPANIQDELFGKGVQGADSPGTGMGLYLVRTLAEAYDGDVWVEDNEPSGAVFTVRLPTVD